MSDLVNNYFEILKNTGSYFSNEDPFGFTTMTYYSYETVDFQNIGPLLVDHNNKTTTLSDAPKRHIKKIGSPCGLDSGSRPTRTSPCEINVSQKTSHGNITPKPTFLDIISKPKINYPTFVVVSEQQKKNKSNSQQKRKCFDCDQYTREMEYRRCDSCYLIKIRRRQCCDSNSNNLKKF